MRRISLGGYQYGGDLTDDEDSICSNDERVFESEQESAEEPYADASDNDALNMAPNLERGAGPIEVALSFFRTS